MNIKINIKYSLELEVERILSTLDKINWFREKGYTVSLPVLIQQKISGGNLDISREMISDSLKNEYSESKYENIKYGIQEKWQEISSILDEKPGIIAMMDNEIYEIILTKYGVGGSYNPPYKIIVNFKDRLAEQCVKTIIHEIIHLKIEPLIIKYNIGHWEKERLVDLIFSKILPEMSKVQKLPQEIIS